MDRSYHLKITLSMCVSYMHEQSTNHVGLDVMRSHSLCRMCAWVSLVSRPSFLLFTVTVCIFEEWKVGWRPGLRMYKWHVYPQLRVYKSLCSMIIVVTVIQYQWVKWSSLHDDAYSTWPSLIHQGNLRAMLCSIISQKNDNSLSFSLLLPNNIQILYFQCEAKCSDHSKDWSRTCTSIRTPGWLMTSSMTL